MHLRSTLWTTQAIELTKELNRAVKDANYEEVKRYLLQGANPNDHLAASTPLGEAASCGHLDIVKLLCDHGANIMERNFHERTALHLAILSGQVHIVAYFIECTKIKKLPLINATDRQKETPLHWAIQYAVKNKDEIVSLLIAAGADVKIANDKGITPAELLDTKSISFISSQ